MGTEVPRIRVRDFGALKNMQPPSNTTLIVNAPPVQPPATQPPIFLCQTGATQQNVYLAFLPNGNQIPIQGIIPPPAQQEQMIRLPANLQALQQPIIQNLPQNPEIQYLGSAFKNPPRKEFMPIRPSFPNNIRMMTPRGPRPSPVRTYQRHTLVSKRKLVKVPIKLPINPQFDRNATYFYSHGHVLKKCWVVLKDIGRQIQSRPKKIVHTAPIPGKVFTKSVKSLASKYNKTSSKCSKCKTVTRMEDFWVNLKSQEIRCLACLRKTQYVNRSIESFIHDAKKTILDCCSDSEEDEISKILESF